MAGFRGAGHGERAGGIDDLEGVQAGFEGFDAGEMGAGDLDRRDGEGAVAGGEGGEREGQEVVGHAGFRGCWLTIANGQIT